MEHPLAMLGAGSLRSRLRASRLALRASRERLEGRVKKRWAISCWCDEVLREYDANLVELCEVVTYGVGVAGNDANDGTKGTRQ